MSPRSGTSLLAGSSVVLAALALLAAGGAVLAAQGAPRPGARPDELLSGAAFVLAVLAAFAFAGPDALLARLADLGERGLKWPAFATLGALVSLALLGAGTFAWPVTSAIDSRAIVPDEGLSFAAPGVETWPDGSRGDADVELFEDGKSLGPARAHPEEVRNLGHGRSWASARSVFLSSSDGSDPRQNGRSYTLRYGRVPGRFLVWLLVALAVLLNAKRAARFGAALDAAHPAVLGAVLLAVALAYRVQVALQDQELTFGGHLVKGVPWSDARDWYDAAVAFSRGDWTNEIWRLTSARRPFHYSLLGAVFALVGPSVRVARVLNVALSAAGPVLVFDGLRRIAPRSVALLAGLAQALLLYDARSDLSVMTEPLGDTLAAAAFWAFVLGAELSSGEAARPRSALLAFLGGGVALGLSNLARPLTLIAVAGLPVALALFAGKVALPWRRLLAGTAAFGAGVALTVGPWMLRQHAVHGIWTISENTTEGWFAATSPTYRHWSVAVGRLAGDRSLAERVAFYAEGTSRNLHEHLGWYVKHVLSEAWVGLRLTQPVAWVLLAASAWHATLVLGATERPSARALASVGAAALVAIFVLTQSPPLHVVTVLALILSVAARRPITLLVAFFATAFVPLSMIAMAGDRRLTHALDWTTAALAAWLVREGLEAIAGTTRAPARLGDGRPWGRAGRFAGALVLGAVLFALAGFGRVLVSSPPPAASDPVLPREPWVARVDSATTAALGPLAERLVVRRARLAPGFAMHFRADERIGHWAFLFDPRPYEFTIAFTDPPIPERYAVIPGPLPASLESAELVLVGVPVIEPGVSSTLEVFAAGVATERGEPTWAPAPEVARAHARFVAALAGSHR